MQGLGITCRNYHTCAKIQIMTTQLKEALRAIAKEKKITPQEVMGLLKAGDVWKEVRGILKYGKTKAQQYQKEMRKEWGHS